MQPRNGIHTLDTYRPTFDPHLDIATVVFSHVQCVKTRLNLARVSKLWRDASKPAAAYPRTFDFDAFPNMDEYAQFHEDEYAQFHDMDIDPFALWTEYPQFQRIVSMMDNDEALSLPYERVVGLLGETAKVVCDYAACLGSVRLLKWARENNCDWSAGTCSDAALHAHLPALKYLHENGCPWDNSTCHRAAYHKHWDCLQYAVDNKCPEWEIYAKKHAKHLR